jgi:hypothetical protein
MGMHKITGLQDGSDDYDAINVRQFRTVTQYGFSSIADAEAATIPTDQDYVYVKGFRFTYTASTPAHVAYFTNTASGRNFQYSDPVFWSEAISDFDICNGDADDAATAAFLLDIPLQLKSGTAYLDVTITASASAATPEARHAYLQSIIKWRASCFISPGAKLRIRSTETGLCTVSAWDGLGDGVPVHYWRGGHAGTLYIEGQSYTAYTISSITFGTRAASTYPIERGANEYEVSIVVTSALPAYVVAGYALGLRNVDADNDGEVISGAIIVETISGDRLTVTGTHRCTRTANLVSPTVINSSGSYTYQGMLASRVIVPSWCLGWDTSYTVSASKAITGYAASSTKTITGITNAIPAVVTAVAHGYANGDYVSIDSVVGMEEINGDGVIVTNAAANTFEAYDVDGNPVDTTPYGTYSSGGNARRPSQLTCVAHSLADSDNLRIDSVGGTTQLNGRQFHAGDIISANVFELLNLSHSSLSDSAYGAYTSGGNMSKVVELWTGSADEGYFNFMDGGIGEFAKMGMAYQGWLIGATGTRMDQDAIFVADPGSNFETADGAVFAGAGDTIVRVYARGNTRLSFACAGNGGAQKALWLQAASSAQLVRSCLGGTVRETIAIGDGCHANISTSVITSGTANIDALKTSSAAVATSKVSGGLRAIYSIGGNIDLATSVLVRRNTIGLDGIAGGIITGLPTYSNNTSNSSLTQDGVGGSSTNRGGARHIASIAGNQTPQTVYGTMTFGAGGAVNLDSATATDSGSGVTISKMAGEVTSQSLTTASGATATITVTNTLATATSFITLSRIGGTNSAGTPEIYATRASGSFVITIKNNHASAAFNGTFIIQFELKAA